MPRRFRFLLAGLVVFATFGALPVIARAGDIDSEIELLRSDLKSGKVDLIGQALHPDSAQAAKFWPVYRAYQLELDKIGDQRVAMIKDYAANFDKMTAEKAKTLVKQALDQQSARTALLKKYYPQFEKTIGSIEAAKLVQIENMVMNLVDLQIQSELPLVQKPTAKQ